MIETRDLGVIAYDRALALQRQCVDDVINGTSTGVLLLCEHPPVLTLGRMADREHILFSGEALSRQGISVLDVDRGGEVTLHAPGQLILYPILDLTRFGRDLHRYLHQLEQVGIDFLRLFDIVGKRISGKTGVWIGEKKIMSVGIGVRRWVSYHGLGINIHTDLPLFQMIRPCGLDVEMTSLERHVEFLPAMDQVKRAICGVFYKEFGV